MPIQRLSILDQSVAVAGRGEDAALRDSLDAAVLAEQLGYARYWVSEHHNLPAIVGTAPEVLMAAIAARTTRIRIGSAGVMLPHYAAFKVAEQFRVLDALAPGRIDLGVGRAPGGDRRTAMVLNPYASGMAEDFPQQVQQLAAWVARGPASRPAAADASLATLADDLRASPYAVLVWEAGSLPEHGALIVERLNSIVGTLNQTTRAATCALAGNDGGASVNQTFTWLSGLPLRTRVSSAGLEHDPHRFGTARLLADDAVDGVLWGQSFDAARVPPATTLPRIVLGPPAMAAKLDANDVFMPVATPGLNAHAHLFRTDGPVLLHLEAARDDGLATVAAIAGELLRALEPTA